jgi:hypothetical protein
MRRRKEKKKKLASVHDLLYGRKKNGPLERIRERQGNGVGE